jgi:DNA-binding MarR family transcriptional regulator
MYETHDHLQFTRHFATSRQRTPNLEYRYIYLIYLLRLRHDSPRAAQSRLATVNGLNLVNKPAATSQKHRKMLEVLEQFRIIVNSIRRHYREVEHRAGLTGSQLWALAQVASRPGCQVGELARALAIHQPNASTLLRQLERLGLLTRRRHGRDQRHVQLFATRKGHEILKRAPHPLIGVLQQALMELTAPALHDLHDRLAGVIRHMRMKSLSARAKPMADYRSD